MEIFAESIGEEDTNAIQRKYFSGNLRNHVDEPVFAETSGSRRRQRPTLDDDDCCSKTKGVSRIFLGVGE